MCEHEKTHKAWIDLLSKRLVDKDSPRLPACFCDFKLYDTSSPSTFSCSINTRVRELLQALVPQTLQWIIMRIQSKYPPNTITSGNVELKVLLRAVQCSPHERCSELKTGWGTEVLARREH